MCARRRPTLEQHLLVAGQILLSLISLIGFSVSVSVTVSLTLSLNGKFICPVAVDNLFADTRTSFSGLPAKAKVP